MAATYLFLLWGPAYYTARKYLRAGYPSAFRALRFILPAQVVATVSLSFAAEEFGLPNPAGLLVAFTLASSAAGALACKLLGWHAARS